jgi:UBA-like domain/Thioredoxin-like
MHEHHLLMDAGADGTTPSSINTTECNVVDCLQQQSQTHHAAVGDEETSLIREKKIRLEEEHDGWIVLSVPCTNEIDATTVSIEICADYAIEAATTNKLQLRDKVIRDKEKTCEQFEASVKSSTQVHDSNTVQQDIADVDERPEIIEEHVKVATAQLQKLSSRQQIESDYELQSVMDRLTKFVAVRDEQICTRQINLQGVEERTQVNDNGHNGNEEYKSAELLRILKEKLSKMLDAITKVVERQIPTETKAMMIFLNHLQNKMRKKFQQNNTLATITALHKTISNIESRLLETEIYPMSREHTPNNNISSGYNEHISEFMIVTGTDDATKAAAYIEMSDNDVQIAIGLYMDGLLEKSIDQLNNNANDNSDSVKPVCFWDMFSPPIHLTHKSGGFAGAQTMAQQTKRFLLVNVQRDGEFSCHALNRDVWRDELVENIIREGFVFWQPVRFLLVFHSFYAVTKR